MYDNIRKFLANIFWPYFKKYIWPIISEQLLRLIATVFGTYGKKAEDYLKNNTKRRDEKARAYAQEADRQSEAATSQEEAEKYREVAKVWRQVADELRQENERLKEELISLNQNALSDIRDKLQNTHIETDENATKLIVDGEIIALPTLSEDSPELSNS